MVLRRSGSRKDYDRKRKTICQECSVRCGLIAYLKNGNIVDIHGDEDHPVSRGRLCARGIAFVQGLRSPHRITSPVFRKGRSEPFEALEDWDSALDILAEQLRKIKDQHGAESIVIGCDQDASLDFVLGAVRFAKLLGTPHVCHSFDFLETSAGIFPPVFNSAPCYEWGESKCILFIESDMAATHPVAFGWAMDAQKRGTKIIAADTHFTRTMSKADLALSIMPHGGNLLGLALMKMILEDPGQLAAVRWDRLTDPKKWRASFAGLPWQDIESNLGLGKKELCELRALLTKNRPAIIVTGKNLSTLPNYGIWHTLVTSMGWNKTTAGGWYPLDAPPPPLDPCHGVPEEIPGKNTGSRDTGCGVTLGDLLQTAKTGDMPFKAALCSGDCFSEFFSLLKEPVEQMDLVATFGAFPGVTHELSHMFLPSVLWAERSGPCFSNDQAVQWAGNIVEPNPGCRSGLDFWVGLGRRFGWQDHFPWVLEDGFADHLAFYQWVLETAPATAGYRLDEIMKPNEPPVLHFLPGTKVDETPSKIDPLHAPETIEPSFQETDQEQYPLYFQRTPFVTHSGEAGSWWPWARTLEQEDAVQLNPETASALGIENGDEIIVSGSAGDLEGRAWISRVVPQWMVSSPRNSVGDRVVVHKKGRPVEETLTILRELLQ